MPAPISYRVDYCVMDEKAGANPFWHACLVFSTQHDKKGPIRVRDSFGLYSLPSTTTNPVIKFIKEDLLGFKVNLQDSPGNLREEKMRDLDGQGLHSISFEVTEKAYGILLSLIERDRVLEEEADLETTLLLTEKGEEPFSHARIALEEQLAKEAGRKSRYARFHIDMGITENGFDTTKSHACKNYALNLLQEAGIIDAASHAELIGNPASHAFPRFGHALAPVRLVSVGEPSEEHSKSSNKIYYNRNWTKNKLYWATMPQSLESLKSEEEQALVKAQYEQINTILTRAHQMEITLRQAHHQLDASDEHKERKEQLRQQIDSIQHLYHVFKDAPSNKDQDLLASRLLLAESKINAAELTLAPEILNSIFIFRALQSFACVSAMTLLTAGIAVAALGLILNPIVAAVTGVAVAIAGYQLYSFFSAEAVHAQKVVDYQKFKPVIADANEVVNDIGEDEWVPAYTS